MTAQIIPMPRRAHPDIDEVDRAFQSYVAAKEHADRTHDLMDGIAAGVAWRRFLELFIKG